MSERKPFKAIATPLVIATSVVTVLTGILMFFDLDRGLNRLAHERISIVFAIAIVLHVWRNWPGFLRVLSNHTGKSLLVLGLLVALLSFVHIDQKSNEPAFIKAPHAILDAPLSKALPVLGLDQASFQQLLAIHKLSISPQDATLREVTLENKMHPLHLIDVLLKQPR
ncbi:MAG: hypothetical protein EoVTN8_78 [Fluviibacter phosphoraccumulans EoVTN8]